MSNSIPSAHRSQRRRRPSLFTTAATSVCLAAPLSSAFAPPFPSHSRDFSTAASRLHSDHIASAHRPLHESDVSQSNNLVLWDRSGTPHAFSVRGLSSLAGKYGGLASTKESGDSLSLPTNPGVLGFDLDDSQYQHGLSTQLPLDDFEQYRKDFPSHLLEKTVKPKVGLRPVTKIRPSKSRASLLRNGQTTTTGTKRSTKHTDDKEEVPPWLPWLPTKSQIMCLKVKELRAACKERGLLQSGKKDLLQQRLLIWAATRDKKRVEDRLLGLKDLVAGAKQSKDGEAKTNLEYDVELLTSKRKAMTADANKEKPDKKKGILGLVDQSYFDPQQSNELATSDEEDDEIDPIVNEESVAQLSRSFRIPTKYSNHELREMYMQTKFADQNGDREGSKSLLRELREATPHDMRVVRRLARMEQEDGNLATARMLLQQALRKEPNNAHLLQGLAQLERQVGNDSVAIQYYQKAIESNPSLPNPYHALGTLEHNRGNIKTALSVIKEGLKHSPNNHRLHHALGDIYMDAQMFDMAENSYLSAFQNVEREWGKAFIYASLSFVAYSKGDIEDCRALLRRSLDVNGGMHAQGVIALAQLEESEGNINDARKVYRDSINRYEKKRSRRGSGNSESSLPKREVDPFDNSFVNGLESQHSMSYSGDKWINVFRSWARMESIHGSYETAHIVFSWGARLFPESTALLTEWAQLQVEHNYDDKAKLLFEAACQRVSGRSAEPYRLFAEFEMERNNFHEAQSILFRGAQSVSESPDSSVDCKIGLASLFHTWGVCECHLGNVARAQQLFDDAIRVTGSGESDSNIRSLILYSMAKLEFQREEYLLAQHCVALSIKEYLLPGGNSRQWKLWADVANMMENDHLVKRCREQASLRYREERGGRASDLSRMYEERDIVTGETPHGKGPAMKDMFRRTPWYSIICTPGRLDQTWRDGARLWYL